MKTALKIFILLALVIAPFALIEIGLRLAGYHLEFPYTDDPYVGYALTPNYHGPGPELYGIPRKIDLRVNSLGFRGPQRSRAKNERTKRVVVLGDSCSFGLGLAEDQTYSALLEGMLNDLIRADYKVEVVNTGVPGYTSYQGVQMLKERALDLNPDILIVYFGWNDHWFSERGLPDHENFPAMQKFVEKRLARNRANPLRNSRTFQFLTDMILRLQDQARLKAAPPKPPKEVYRVPLTNFRDNLMEIVRQAIRHRIGVIFITPPHGFTAGKIPTEYLMENLMKRDDSLIALHESYVDAVREVAEKTHAPLLDMEKFFNEGRRDVLMEKDGIHPSAAGHRVIAQELSPMVAKQLRGGK